MSERVLQEFYCTESGGGCGGYIRVNLNVNIDGIVEVVCPKCGHKHQRKIKSGVIAEDGRFHKSPTQEIAPTMAAYSKEPLTKDMLDIVNGNSKGINERDAVVISRRKDPIADAMLRESMLSRWGKKLLRK